MSTLDEYFLAHARLSRRALANFADASLDEIDEAAEALEFGSRLSLDQAEDVISYIEQDDDGAAQSVDDAENDEEE